MSGETAESVTEKMRFLIENWCERREYQALAIILPAWVSNNGLTDGWHEIHDAFKHAHGACRHLPQEERALLKDVYVGIERRLDSQA